MLSLRTRSRMDRTRGCSWKAQMLGLFLQSRNLVTFLIICTSLAAPVLGGVDIRIYTRLRRYLLEMRWSTSGRFVVPSQATPNSDPFTPQLEMNWMRLFNWLFLLYSHRQCNAFSALTGAMYAINFFSLDLRLFHVCNDTRAV